MQTSNMKIFGYFRSSASYRVRIAMNLKGLTPEEAFVNLRRFEGNTPEFRAVNPIGLVPTLIHDGQVFWQSMAIIEYLEDVFPEPPLLPNAPADRAFVRSLAQLIACDIHPLNNLRVLNFLGAEFGVFGERKTQWYDYWIAEGFTALESILSTDRRVGRFCFGDSPSLADLFLVPQVFNAERMNCSLELYPTIRRIAKNARSLTAFAAAEPSRQPDAPSPED